MFESIITDITSQITEWRALVLLGVITLIGLGRLVQKHFRMQDAESLGAEAYEKYLTLWEDICEGKEHLGVKGNESIFWLTTNVHRIKMQMGSGYYGSYQPMNDVRIILKKMPEFQQYVALEHNQRAGIYVQNINISAIQINAAFTRYNGALEYEVPRHLKKMINPLLWLREGVAWVLSLLLLLLSLFVSPFGFLGAATRERIIAGSWFRLASDLISLVGGLIMIIPFVASWIHQQ